MHLRWTHLALLALPASLLTACSDDDSGCNPTSGAGCDDGLVCEEVAGGAPACFAPYELHGQVFDLQTDGAVAGARLVALDANGSPRSSVAVSDGDGSYVLTLHMARNADGTPASAGAVTLRADAAGYQSFPGGVRQAVPIDLSQPTTVDGTLVVESALTDVGLLELAPGSPTGMIHGHVEAANDGPGVLVVAEAGGAGLSAIADRDGDYRIFNVPDGSYTVRGYSRGAEYQEASGQVSGGSDLALDLDRLGDAAASVTGKVSIVNPGGATATSVILVVASTFNATLARGETPPGLRAPDPGLAPDVTGDFTIDRVPPGRYAVLAAFENDGLVRDPDACIAGTDVVYIDVAPGQALTISDSFKVTGALEVLSPAPGEVSGAPMFSWVDDSSEDEYAMELFDSYGNMVWQKTIAGASGSDPQVLYDGEALIPGMTYQYRVTSRKDGCALSTSEDLRGIFEVAPN